MAKYTAEEVLAAYQETGSYRAAGRLLGCDHSVVRKRIKRMGREYEVEELPSGDEPIEQLIDRRIEQYARKHEAERARNLIEVKVRSDEPIGILHFGDPHVDDDGTDIRALRDHARIVRETPGMWAANIGDTTNNWVGRLARLYGDQSTSAQEAWRLAEWFLESVQDWLYVIGGNHDAWSGAGDPLKWILNQNHGPFLPGGVRLNLCFPGGRAVRINARHDFKGHSQWNTAHGVSKAAQMGWRDHILICGHKHVSGYQQNVHPDPETGIDMGLVSHCIRIASYKRSDRYAKELGLPDQSLGPCCVTVINPRANSELNLVRVFWDPQHAADYLTWLRAREAA